MKRTKAANPTEHDDNHTYATIEEIQEVVTRSRSAYSAVNCDYETIEGEEYSYGKNSTKCSDYAVIDQDTTKKHKSDKALERAESDKIYKDNDLGNTVIVCEAIQTVKSEAYAGTSAGVNEEEIEPYAYVYVDGAAGIPAIIQGHEVAPCDDFDNTGIVSEAIKTVRNEAYAGTSAEEEIETYAYIDKVVPPNAIKTVKNEAYAGTSAGIIEEEIETYAYIDKVVPPNAIKTVKNEAYASTSAGVIEISEEEIKTVKNDAYASNCVEMTATYENTWRRKGSSSITPTKEMPPYVNSFSAKSAGRDATGKRGSY